MVFYVNIWTGMASNNTISWSATYDSTVQYQNTDLFPPWTRLRIADSSALLDELCPYFCLNPMMVHRKTCVLIRSRPNQITGPGPKSGPAGKSESRGPENGVSRWRRPNSAIYSQNHHFRLVYDMIYQFLGMDAKNYKFGMFCQQCHPSVASGDADIRPRNASRIHTRHLFTS